MPASHAWCVRGNAIWQPCSDESCRPALARVALDAQAATNSLTHGCWVELPERATWRRGASLQWLRTRAQRSASTPGRFRLVKSVGDESADLVVEDRFAIVPEWLLDADIGDSAVRLYAVLLRYGSSSGARMPSRSTLAKRLRKRSTDSVDRAMKELASIGAVRVEHRYDGSQRLTNAYHVRTSRPRPAKPPTPRCEGSRKSAATPPRAPRGRSQARLAAARAETSSRIPHGHP